MNSVSNVKYPKKSIFTDKSKNITSIVNSDMIYLLRFDADSSEGYDEDRHSFRYIKIVNNEAHITALRNSQFRKSFTFTDPEFLKRRWNYDLRLK